MYSKGLVITFLHPEGYRGILRDTLRVAILVLKSMLDSISHISTLPASAKIPANTDRNREIYNRYMTGERAQKLADDFGISVRRVNWLITHFCQNSV
jgi:hypothetical protein